MTLTKMASSIRHREEQEFKLPLRQWLLKKIEEGSFDGLVWLDKPNGIFKIPWTAKHHPNWEKHYEIFREWAKHKDKYDTKNPPDEKKLKGNFRCALHKSIDFEEIRDQGTMNQQTGNHKIYRVLRPDEVKEKNKQKKKLHLEAKTAKTSPPASFSPTDTATLQNDFQEGNGYSHLSSSMLSPYQQLQQQACFSPGEGPMDVDFQQPTIGQSAAIKSNYSDISESTPFAYPGPSGARAPNRGFMQRSLDEVVNQHQHQQQESPPPPPPYHFASPDSVVEVDDLSNLEALIYSPIDSEDLQKMSPTVGPSEQFNTLVEIPRGPETPSTSLRRIASQFEIEWDHMFRYKVYVLYENIMIMDEEFDLRQPIRLFHGDAQMQKAILEAFSVSQVDLKAEPISLPKYEGNNDRISQILQHSDQGFILKCDAEGSLQATRLSQSVLFYFDDDQPRVAKKMERYKPVQLFSYRNFWKEVRQSTSPSNLRGRRPSIEAKLHIGTKPSSPRHNSLVMVCIESLAARNVLATVLGEQNSVLAISVQNSIDQLLRIIN